MTQFLLALFSLSAVALFNSRQPALRRLAPVFGLMGQPFWLYSTFVAGQWGMIVLSLVYTAIYIFAIARNYWSPE